MKLSEADHSYYCEEGNYFSTKDTSCRYESFDEFLAEWDSHDMDFNLLFRWDWNAVLDDDSEEPTGEFELKLFYLLQRKGYHLCCIVKVTPEDDERVKQWLHTRWEHLVELWRPVSCM